MTTPLVVAEGLQVHFPVRKGGLFGGKAGLRAVDGVDISITHGETLGLVGESGCGKSTTGRALIRLIEPTAGRVLFDGEDLTALSPGRLRQARRNMQIVFQDPYGSLNPRMKVKEIIGDSLAIHGLAEGDARGAQVADLLEMVGLDARHGDRYPHEFSGGQRQRIAIARALAVEPRFIVADEPVSALDVSIQAQVLNVLARLREELRLTYLFISHDLSVVRHISDRVAVMYLGRIVEIGGPNQIYEASAHPYTRALVSSIPLPDPVRERKRVRIVLKGDVPSPLDPPAGCPFSNRCWMYEAMGRPARCTEERPELTDLGNGQSAACHFAGEVASSGTGLSHVQAE